MAARERFGRAALHAPGEEPLPLVPDGAGRWSFTVPELATYGVVHML